MKLYVEGGGESKSLKTRCQEGFRKFLEKAGLEGRMPRIVASGSRENAYSDFCTALNNSEEAILLVDSEKLVRDGETPWAFLGRCDQWRQPPGSNERCFLMVQCMESWFLADIQALRKFFGQGFKENALPRVDRTIENIPKQDILRGLGEASRSSEQSYAKGSHSFKILASIQPEKVMQVSPQAKRFIDTLKEIL